MKNVRTASDCYWWNNELVLSRYDLNEDIIGIVYRIDLEDGRWYIGKKNLCTQRKKHFGKRDLLNVTDKRLKTYSIEKKESDWLSYTGSNEFVNDYISSGGRYVKKILYVAGTQKELTYLELKALFKFDALEDTYCLNNNILGKFYRRDIISKYYNL